MKKLITLLLSITILVSLSVAPVYAHTFPSDINKWTKKDWKKWNEYWEKYWEDHEDGFYELYYDDERRIIWEEPEEHKDKKHREDYKPIIYDTPNNCNPNYNYNNFANYNYYNGIINAYDSGTEDQAQILAKIIYLYGHGVSSQTQQACIGWAVTNSADASGSGVSIGRVASNFHYDASLPTTDDFGRDLIPLARDIIFRWKAGRAGVGNNGRVLPGGYYYLWSTGSSVAIRNTPDESSSPWNFSYASPYGN